MNWLFKKSHLLILLIAVIFVFIFLVRTVGLFNNNILFLFDSARDFLWVKKIVVDHKFILIGPSSGGLQGYFQGVFWYYLLAIPFAISNGNPLSGPWFMVVCSIASVTTAFFIFKKIHNIHAAILSSIILGFAGYSVATTQFIWNPYPIVWLMPLYFLGIYLLAKHSKWGIMLLSILQGLIMHFEIIYGLGILPGFLILVGYFIFKGKQHNKIKTLIISALLFILPFIPSLLFDMRHQFLMTKSIVTTITTGGQNLTHKGAPDNLTTRIILRIDDLKAFTLESVTTNVLVNYTLFILFLIGVGIMIRIKKDAQQLTTIVLTTIILLSPFFVFLFLKYSVWGYYWIGTAPLYAMLLCFGLGFLFEYYKEFRLFWFLAIILLFMYAPWSAINQWYGGGLVPGYQVFSTQQRVLNYIYNDAHGEKFSAYEQTPPVYDYVYRYLFWWQGRKYGYIPTDEKQKNVYVILENVPSDPDAIYFVKNTLHITEAPITTEVFGDPYPKVEKFIIDPSKELPVDPNFFPQL